MKKILILLCIFIINCSGNKVSNYHGAKKLELKFSKIELNKTNKNDIIQLLGPPSTISNFDKNKWFYIERLKSNQSLLKLGAQKIKKNNILLVEFNNNGLLKSKKMFDLNNMNDVKYLKKTTEKDFQNDSIIYGVFTSLREKINSPTRNLGK